MADLSRLSGPRVSRERLLASPSHDLQQEAEQVDDVQVDVEGGEYVFLRADGVALVPQQHLGVERQELRRGTASEPRRQTAENDGGGWAFDSYQGEEDGSQDRVRGV